MRARAAPKPGLCLPPSTSRRPCISMRREPTSCTSPGCMPRNRSPASSRTALPPDSSPSGQRRSNIFRSVARYWPNVRSAVTTRILAIADEVDEALYGDKLDRLDPHIVLSCGDLPFDYLEHIVSRLNVPLLYVPGNHDPDLSPGDSTWSPLSAEPPRRGPEGCINVDGRVVDAAGLRVAGLGGSMRYKPGPNQYSESQMFWRGLPAGVGAGPTRGRGRGVGHHGPVTPSAAAGFGGRGRDVAHRRVG